VAKTNVGREETWGIFGATKREEKEKIDARKYGGGVLFMEGEERHYFLINKKRRHPREREQFFICGGGAHQKDCVGSKKDFII